LVEDSGQSKLAVTESRNRTFKNRFPKMNQPQTVEKLIAFLNGLEPVPQDLVSQLTKQREEAIPVMMKLTKEELERHRGLNGLMLYNYLHPSPHSSLRSADPNPVQSRRNKLLTFGNSTGTSVPSQFRSSRTETLEAFDRRRSPGNLVYVICYTII
jgi:hypothetical protein